METRKSYRKRGTRDCPISLSHYYVGCRRTNAPCWQPEMMVLYVRSGQLTYVVEDTPISLSVGDVLIIAPEQVHQMTAHSPDVDVRYLTFSLDALVLSDYHIFQKEFVQPLRDGLLELPQVLRPGHPAHDRVYEILCELHTHTFYSPNYKIHFYVSTVSLCAALLPWCKKKETALSQVHIANATVYKAIIYLHNHYGEPITLNTVAKYVHLNPCYLSSLIKQETGKTFSEHLAQIRIEAALYLLRRDDLSMSEVAEKAGFGSEAMFYRKFKAVMGMTPTAYRRSQTLLRTPDCTYMP